ncbi:Hypothetical_protein [Hexamita inflata]|uniref:Hypothetical_protein n=1 Tax=Hexamita inflata TaxID=28002 RepID=A0AA86UQ23_9EUKA|nr:Hypothetical protein HINF_LOCUS34398 [Hexamita inflata]
MITLGFIIEITFFTCSQHNQQFGFGIFTFLSGTIQEQAGFLTTRDLQANIQTLASKNCLNPLQILGNLLFLVLILSSSRIFSPLAWRYSFHKKFCKLCSYTLFRAKQTTVLVMAAQGQARNSILICLITSYLSLQEKLQHFLFTTFTGWVLFQVIGAAGDSG